MDKGWVIIPCELIDYNGEALKTLVLRYAQEWQLPRRLPTGWRRQTPSVPRWSTAFVTGYPREEAAALEASLGYHDAFLDTAEHFYLFVIQGPQWLAGLNLAQCPLNIRVVSDIKPYKEA